MAIRTFEQPDVDSMTASEKNELLQEGVKEAKSQIELPLEVDGYTLLTDITADSENLIYYYMVDDSDPEMIYDIMDLKEVLPARYVIIRM